MLKPLAQSIAHATAGSKRRSRAVRCLAIVLCCTWALAERPARADIGQLSGLMPIRFEAAEVELDGSRLADVRLVLDGVSDFRFESGGLSDAGGEALLGEVELAGRIDTLQLADEGLRADGTAQYEGLESGWSVNSREEGFSLCLQLGAQPLGLFITERAASQAAGWIRDGEVEACAHYLTPGDGEDQLDFDLLVRGLSLDSPDGRFAAEALAAEIVGTLEFGEPLTPDISGKITGGEVLLDNFYGNFNDRSLAFSLQAVMAEGQFAGSTVTVEDDGALHVAARLDAGHGDDGWRLHVDRLHLAFPGAYRRYLEPVAAAWTLDGLQVTGSLDWQGSISSSEIDSGDLDISDLSVVDTSRNRFALTGLNTSLRPGDYQHDSQLGWQGLLLGRINLGAGEALLDSEPGAFALLEPLELGVLGGQVRLDRLRYALPGSPSAQERSRFELEASLADIDMEQLTAAFDWPGFSGRLSGEVPGVRFEDGVLDVDGEITVQVFDGTVRIRQLAAERVFGVLPSLSADIELDDLDLEQLTETFEFGRIGGRIDGHVANLRMLDWSPVAFDAWAGTPERQGSSSEISRQAVNHLTTIGGGGATAALSGPLIRMFNNFSYKRLGLGCRLANNVCAIRGLEDDGQSVLILEGSGLPKITVRAFNRSVDWPQMVANLAAVSSGESVRVGEPD